MLHATPQPDFQQEVLDKLNRALDLVLKTAEAASADNNHKVVIQAAREVTRIATLITKMTNPKTRPASVGRESQEPPAKKNKADKKLGEGDLKPEDLLLPDLETFFPPHEVASLDDVSREFFDNISRGYQEMQAIGADLAASLEKSAPGNGRGR